MGECIQITQITQPSFHYEWKIVWRKAPDPGWFIEDIRPDGLPQEVGPYDDYKEALCDAKFMYGEQ